MFILSLLSLTISMTFTLLSHPVSFSLMIFLQTILVSVMCGMISNLFWFSYLLFLIMIGGILVLFLYMINVASNEKFNYSKLINLIFLTSILYSFNYFLLDNFFLYLKISLWNNLLMNKEFELTLLKFYNYPYNMVMILLMIYLLITMIMSVKITNLKKGALRQKF